MCNVYESPEVAIALGPSETEGPGAGGGATWLAQLARLNTNHV